MTKNANTVIRKWVPLAMVTTGLCFLLFLLVQQSQRQAANDPQIAIAEDLAASLDQDISPGLPPTLDMAKSLTPFVIVYDEQGNVVNATAKLDGMTPKVPKGVLEAAKQKGFNRVTWQPKSGVRIATSIVPYKNGYVLAGRNLREVENRAEKEFHLMVLGLASLLASSFLAVVFLEAVCGDTPVKKSGRNR